MRVLFSTVAATALASLASAQITPYSQDFEGLTQTDPMALENDGWLVYGNVFDNTNTYQYGYGSFPAPNAPGAFCQVVLNEGGAPQGAQQLVILSDYNNLDHAQTDWLIEANTFKEWIVDASDVGKTYRFTFDAKLGNILAPSQNYAFIKTIDNVTFNVSGAELLDMSGIPTTWGTFSTVFTVNASMVGHFFQIGFVALASNYDPSGVFYDNIVFEEDGGNPNNVGTNYCLATTNSTGSPSTISGTGSASISADDLILTANNLPPQPGIFIAGPTQAQIPFFNGFLCVAPTGLQRFVAVNTPAGGVISEAVVIATSALGGLNVAPSSSYYYQRWNRDPAAGGGNANFSNGLDVMYMP